MTKLKKVIAGLECCINHTDCDNCPYKKSDSIFLCGDEMQRDALPLLKERVPVSPKHILQKYSEHKWVEDEDGDIDVFAFDMDFHNGPVCERCGCGFGGYMLDTYDAEKKCRVGTAQGLEAIMQLMKALEVEKWEDLKGEYIRCEIGRTRGGRITKVGHLIKDQWFSFEEFFNKENENE